MSDAACITHSSLVSCDRLNVNQDD